MQFAYRGKRFGITVKIRGCGRDIRVMLEHLETAERSFASSYPDTTGRSLPCFNLPNREILVLVSCFSVELRDRIIERLRGT
jgi:hypothetical protein